MAADHAPATRSFRKDAAGSMQRVQIASIHTLGMWFRQTPRIDGWWGDTHFVFDTGQAEPDWLIVYDQAPSGFQTRVPRHRRVVFLSEPSTIKHYPTAYLQQFSIIVSISPIKVAGSTVIIRNPALPWMYGIDINSPGGPRVFRDWDDLARDHSASRPGGEISVVCSTKTMNLNQHRRLRFLELLRAELGSRLTVFGRGFQPITDKAEGIDGYRYHLVLENNLLDHGWTEKLADPILAGAYPIIAGGQNLASYFDPQGFAMIDTTRPRAAIEAVRRLLEEDPVRREDVRAAMANNKRRLLQEHNFFPVATSIIEQHPSSLPLLPCAEPILPPARPRWRRMMSIPRPLRPPLRRFYLEVFERR